MTLADYYASRPDRCPFCGWHVDTQGHSSKCADPAPVAPDPEWSLFVAAVKQVATNGVVHQAAMRPLIRGRIAPKSIGRYYRRAKDEGLLVDTGEREQSNDTAGRNADKLDRIYRLGAAA